MKDSRQTGLFHLSSVVGQYSQLLRREVFLTFVSLSLHALQLVRAKHITES